MYKKLKELEEDIIELTGQELSANKEYIRTWMLENTELVYSLLVGEPMSQKDLERNIYYFKSKQDDTGLILLKLKKLYDEKNKAK